MLETTVPTDFIGLAPLPPSDARRVAIALATTRNTLRNSRDILQATPNSVTHAQWAEAMTNLIERTAEMEALLVASGRAYETNTALEDTTVTQDETY